MGRAAIIVPYKYICHDSFIPIVGLLDMDPYSSQNPGNDDSPQYPGNMIYSSMMTYVKLGIN